MTINEKLKLIAETFGCEILDVETNKIVKFEEEETNVQTLYNCSNN